MARLNMPDSDGFIEHRPPLSPEQQRSRRNRSIALALVLGGLAAILLALTLANGPSILDRPL